eukprot:jgi/Chlat1/3485/Chrsp23S03787
MVKAPAVTPVVNSSAPVHHKPAAVPPPSHISNGPLCDVLTTNTFLHELQRTGSIQGMTGQAYEAPVRATVGYDAAALLAEEGRRLLDRKLKLRLEKLQNLLTDNISLPVAERAASKREQRMLRAMTLQATVRAQVDNAQAELAASFGVMSLTGLPQVMAMNERAYRKFVRVSDRQKADMARQCLTAQRAAHDQFLKAALGGRRKLSDSQWNIRELRISRNRAVLKYHDRMLREINKKRDDDEREKRLQAIQENDLDAYRRLISEQAAAPGSADERFKVGQHVLPLCCVALTKGHILIWYRSAQVLSDFLSETEKYLQKLGGKVAAVKAQQELAQEAAHAAREAMEEQLELANNRSKGQTQGAANQYYTLAHSITERVTRQPSMLRAGILREYQLVGLQWMVSLYNNHLNGILADEMGLGKTVQVMALIAYLMENKGNYGPHLIIVPNAVLVNWRSEFRRWLPSVSAVCYVGTREERARIYNQDVSAVQFNVLVTSYEFIMRDRAKLCKIDWRYIIIDEAQRMKDRESRLSRDLDRFRCQRRLLLTGTPLQNDLQELWSLLNLLLPEVFDNKKVFNDWFDTSAKDKGWCPFALCRSLGCLSAYGLIDSSSQDEWLEMEKKIIVIHRLHQILEPFMLRRRVEDVERKLPLKTTIVLKSRMSGLQRAVYDWVKATGTIRLDPDEERQRVAVSSSKRQMRAFAPLNNKCMELRKVCNHPYLSYPAKGHQVTDDIVRSCGKLWVLDRFLIKMHQAGHRVLLFSTMTRLLDILEEYLRWRGLQYRRIDGTTPLEAREAAIDDFNAPDSDVFIFLLSIRAAGRGLNLQTADTVVIYDPDPNPKNEEQAIARAHRIGQLRQVLVVYMEAVVDSAASYHTDDDSTEGAYHTKEAASAGIKYTDSIESLVRNTIQQVKIDMADEIINAGRFDQRTTHEERRVTLESLLHDDKRNAQNSHELDSLHPVLRLLRLYLRGKVPSLTELNRLIARDPDEVELFERLDAELDWPAPPLQLHEIPRWMRADESGVEEALAAHSKTKLKPQQKGKASAAKANIVVPDGAPRTQVEKDKARRRRQDWLAEEEARIWGAAEQLNKGTPESLDKDSSLPELPETDSELGNDAEECEEDDEEIEEIVEEEMEEEREDSMPEQNIEDIDAEEEAEDEADDVHEAGAAVEKEELGGQEDDVEAGVASDADGSHEEGEVKEDAEVDHDAAEPQSVTSSEADPEPAEVTQTPSYAEPESAEDGEWEGTEEGEIVEEADAEAPPSQDPEMLANDEDPEDMRPSTSHVHYDLYDQPPPRRQRSRHPSETNHRSDRPSVRNPGFPGQPLHAHYQPPERRMHFAAPAMGPRMKDGFRLKCHLVLQDLSRVASERDSPLLDIAALEARLECGEYTTVDAFAVDIECIFADVLRSSPPGSRPHMDALHLRDVFRRQLVTAFPAFDVELAASTALRSLPPLPPPVDFVRGFGPTGGFDPVSIPAPFRRKRRRSASFTRTPRAQAPSSFFPPPALDATAPRAAHGPVQFGPTVKRSRTDTRRRPAHR